MNRLLGVVRDRPYVVTATGVVVAALHFIAMMIERGPTSPLLSVASDAGSGALLVASYVGLAATAAVAAGFAGVVIVFGLSGQTPVFLRFRTKSGERMRANWISIIGCAFAAAGLGLLAAVLQIASAYALGIALFELGVFLFVHSAARTVWVLLVLIKVVQVDDGNQLREANTIPAASLFGSAR